MTELLQAAVALSERLAVAETIGDALESVAGDACPSLVQVYRDQLRAIREASEVLESCIRGIGVVDPDGSRTVDKTASSRFEGGGAPHPAHAPEKQLCGTMKGLQ